MRRSTIFCYYDGKKESITELSKKSGIMRSTLVARVRRCREMKIIEGLKVSVITEHHLRPTQSCLHREAPSSLSTLWLKRSLVGA
jgi:hypothetical protein|tara:strand:+ start:532 stop:786 length:255 start_codon:yes stop_codon:yes gene_type:complete